MSAPSEFSNALVIEVMESVEFVEVQGESWENIFYVFKLRIGGEQGLPLAQQCYWDKGRTDPNAPFLGYSIIYDDECDDLDHARQLFNTFIYSRMSRAFNNSMGGRK